MPLSSKVRDAIDRAIQGGAEPYAPARSRGLLLRAPGRARGIGLFHRGVPNAAGKYYFEQLRRDPPDHGFDHTSAVREGRKEIGMLKNGRRVVLRVFNGKDWSFTRLGKEYYKTARKQYIVQLPILNVYQKDKGRTSVEGGLFMPSTATTLGAITLPYVFDNPERELRRRVDEWISTLKKEKVDGLDEEAYVVG